MFLFVVSFPLRGHDDEVLDVCFDFTGQYIATASADGKKSPFTIQMQLEVVSHCDSLHVSKMV